MDKKHKNSKQISESGSESENDISSKNKKLQTKLKNFRNRHKEITNDIIYDQDDDKYNTPIVIKYKNKAYKISIRLYYDQNEVIWN